MKNLLIILLSCVCIFQVCNAATVEDAETELRHLRKLTTSKLQAVQVEQNRMLDEIDSAAKAAKEYGNTEIQQKAKHLKEKLIHDPNISHKCRGATKHIVDNLQQSSIADLMRCVDHEKAKTVEHFSTQRLALDERVKNAIYKEEKHIILCKVNRKCLDEAIIDVKDHIAEVHKLIHEEIHVNQKHKELQVHLIKSCADRSIGNAEHAFNNVPNCPYEPK